MADYTTGGKFTLTTSEVREGYSQAYLGDGSLVDQETVAAENRGDFDRWLAAHDAEVARKAAEKGWDEGQGAGTVAAINFTPLPPNPYRAEQIGENRGND